MLIRYYSLISCFVVFLGFSSAPLLAAVEPEYFQQKLSYSIDVSLDDENKMLHGYEEIVYRNNSPDTLTYIYMHLWPNAYRTRHTPFARQQVAQGETDFYFGRQTDRGFIDSLNFAINGNAAKWHTLPGQPDVCKLYFPAPLLPGDSLTVSTPFIVMLPLNVSRGGFVGDAFQITQWYPKPAVYDKDGHHPLSYLDMGEFYSEFADYRVKITLPENYVVAATGILQTPAEKIFLEELEKNSLIRPVVLTTPDFIPSSDQFKTIEYRQDSIHDFAWFADKRFKVAGSEITLPGSGRKVTTKVFYTDAKAPLWKDAAKYIDSALYYYSLWNGDYPYAECSAVDGALYAGGGMEYPMITVIGNMADPISLDRVIAHEVGHNWFYGVLATNERKNPWMDEGLNTANEIRYMEQRYPQLHAFHEYGNFLANKFDWDRLPLRCQSFMSHAMLSRAGADAPAALQADEYSTITTGTVVYEKTGGMFTTLRNWWGDEKYDRAMHYYFEKWQFRHPGPGDMKAALEESTGEDLDWFFDEWLNSSLPVDYAVKAANVKNDSLHIKLKNKTGLPVPFRMVILDKEGRPGDDFVQIEQLRGDTVIVIAAPAGAHRVLIDPKCYSGDAYLTNNSRKVTGSFKGMEPLRMRFLTGYEQPLKSQLYYLPIAGFNTSDGVMAGIAIHNSGLPAKKTDWIVAPQWSFAEETPTGYSHLRFWYPHGQLLRPAWWGVRVRSYAGLTVAALESEVELYNPFPGYRSTHSLSAFSAAGFADRVRAAFYPDSYVYNYVAYNFKTGDAIKHLELKPAVQNFDFNSTAAEVEAKMKWQYSKRNFIKMRMFGGAFIGAGPSHNAFKYYLSGSPDLAGVSAFVDRQYLAGAGLQTDLKHGGFRGYIPAGAYNNLWSCNFDIDLPGRVFTVFADVGSPFISGDFSYDAGLTLNIIRDMIMIYWPVAGSMYSGGIVEGANIAESIRFHLNLVPGNNFNLFRKTLITAF